MEISQKPEVSHIRVYEDGLSYENKDPFIFITTVHHLGDDEVFLSGAKGEFNRGVLRLIAKHLSDQGIKVIRYEKVKKSKVFSRKFFTW